MRLFDSTGRKPCLRRVLASTTKASGSATAATTRNLPTSLVTPSVAYPPLFHKSISKTPVLFVAHFNRVRLSAQRKIPIIHSAQGIQINHVILLETLAVPFNLGDEVSRILGTLERHSKRKNWYRGIYDNLQQALEEVENLVEAQFSCRNIS